MGKRPSPVMSCCEMRVNKKTFSGKKNRNAFYRHLGDFKWRGIKDESYKAKSGGWSGIMRRVLIGSHGESAKFHVRYFEIAPGGNSSLERHGHEHVVICVKGEGLVRIGRTKRKMGFMDTVYVAPHATHQLINSFKEPFGFLCIVNSKRDRPELLR